MSNLIDDVLSRLTPLGVFRELHAFIPSLQEPRNGRVEVKGKCPFHDDHRPSWCWNLEKGVACCHVCGTDSEASTQFVRFLAGRRGKRPVEVLDEYCRRFGLARPKARRLSLTDYAAAKHIPVRFLTDRFQLVDDEKGLVLPYLDRNGSVIANRIRRKFGQRPIWREKGTRATKMIYGLHGLSWIAATGYLFIAEGESDLHTAWYYDLPALALPGANVGHKAMAAIINDVPFHTVYVLPDKDHAGRKSVGRLDVETRKTGWSGVMTVAELPAADLSALHTESNGDCQAALGLAIHRARPVADVLATWKREEIQGDNRMMGAVRKVMSIRDANSSDRTILIAVVLAAGTDVKGPIRRTKTGLARDAGIGRRTLFERWNHLVGNGWILEDENGIRLGRRIVRESHK